MPEQRNDRRQPPQSSESPLFGILRLIAITVAAQWLIGRFLQPNKGGTDTAKGAAFDAEDNIVASTEYLTIPKNVLPIWPQNTVLDISMYVSPSVVMPSLKTIPADYLVFEEKEFKQDGADKRSIDTAFKVPKEVQNNGTLWGHYYIGVSGAILDPADPNYKPSLAYHFLRPLNHYLPKKRVIKTKKLLGSEEAATEPEPETLPPKTIVSYYHPNISLSFVQNWGAQNYQGMHPYIRQYMVLESTGRRDASGENGWYYPLLFTNQFWQLRSQMTELNSTVETLDLHVELDTIAQWKFGALAVVDESTRQSQKGNSPSSMGSGDGSEFEEFKRIMLETNIYLLATTGIVTILHMVFETLAFKSDISHWRKKKDNVGVSFRTILGNVFMQAVIFLYLVDNSDGTSWMILAGQGFGIFVEAWKITKTVDVRIRPAPNSIIPYRIAFEDKHKLSDVEKKTEEYDQIAFKYLYMAAVPLLIAYAVYSVLYDTHKSWYSFIITTLVGSVYAYGFLMMVPSLYINYRLQSVAHMPARAMTYKFLNTFIDDLFAFTIKMPTLHRLATLRDDVIFFIYLYQSWKYKVDYTRINEFGQGGDDEELEEKKANKPLTSPADADASVKVEGVETVNKLVEDVGPAAETTGAEKKKATKRKA